MGRYSGRLPHDRGYLLWDEGVASPRFVESIERWVENLLLDDGMSIIPSGGANTSAKLFCKSKGVFAGKEVVNQLIKGKNVDISWFVNDGELVERGILAEIFGPREALLALERTILNLLARLSGIATNTAKWVEAAPCSVACTRKTTWGLLDKWAVHLGGGLTHRLDKSDALMLKENDLVNSNSIQDSLALIDPSEWGFVEIEVRTIEQAEDAARSWDKDEALVIMLDNMNSEDCMLVRERISAENIVLEISGGIRFEKLEEITGVDVISASALNQGVPHLDMSIIFEGVE